jgi:thiol:disulfide interchange protein
MKRLKSVLFLATLLLSAVTFAQAPSKAPDKTVTWKTTSKQISGSKYQVIFDGKIIDGWHIYDLRNEYTPTTVEFGTVSGCSLDGGLYEISKSIDKDGDKVFIGRATIAQNVILSGTKASLKGTINWSACNDQYCAAPESFDFNLDIENTAAQTVPNVLPASTTATVTDSAATAVSAPVQNNPDHQTIIPDPTVEPSKDNGSGGSLWSLILKAILWGFAMLLTPCVFPMIPMTISFFLKGSTSTSSGRFKAGMYGLFIVLLYTVPISLIILGTWLLGGAAVTADIFNWLATHWLPNIIFFIVFMIFAASFFGAFEITLPSSIVNRSDRNSDKKGLLGVFFMALTLVLVSFSCTGPIVGSVLIESTQGEFWTPMVTMLAFSIAFALPFTILAMFPSLLKDLPKSGGWLNSVKVVLGFIEVALGFKFLSVADQTYHWGILDREVYLAIWIVVFTLLGLYLMGKIRFANDDKVEHLSLFRLILIIIDFTFVVYMIPGMWGAPLKALSGYLPPLETQDFVVYNQAGGIAPAASSQTENATASRFDLKLPLGLSGYFTLDEGIAQAKKVNKPVFVDITGHGCVNCREMESRVWSDPKVLQMLKDDFVIVALYTDDKTKLDEKDWVKADNGTVLKDFGRVNSYIVRTRFDVNAQPNYAILDTDGKQLVPIRGYNLDINGFVAFLQSGLDAFHHLE